MNVMDPYSAVRLVLDKFPTEENAKDSMEQRDMEAQRIHVALESISEQLNSLKPSYSGRMNANGAEKERLLVMLNALEKDSEKRRLYLKEKEIELEELQQLLEIRRDILDVQRKELQLLKIPEAESKESWTGDIEDDH